MSRQRKKPRRDQLDRFSNTMSEGITPKDTQQEDKKGDHTDAGQEDHGEK